MRRWQGRAPWEFWTKFGIYGEGTSLSRMRPYPLWSDGNHWNTTVFTLVIPNFVRYSYTNLVYSLPSQHLTWRLLAPPKPGLSKIIQVGFQFGGSFETFWNDMGDDHRHATNSGCSVRWGSGKPFSIPIQTCLRHALYISPTKSAPLHHHMSVLDLLCICPGKASW